MMIDLSKLSKIVSKGCLLWQTIDYTISAFIFEIGQFRLEESRYSTPFGMKYLLISKITTIYSGIFHFRANFKIVMVISLSKYPIFGFIRGFSGKF